MFFRLTGGGIQRDFDTFEEAASAAGGDCEIAEIRYVIQTIGPSGLSEEYSDQLDQAVFRAKAILGGMPPSKRKTHRVMVVEYAGADRSDYKVHYDSGRSTVERYEANVRNLNARGQKYVHIPTSVVNSMGLTDGDRVEITIRKK